MAIIWNDLQTQLSDYVRTYTTGTISQGNQDRSINRAIEYFQRRLSLPSDRRIYRFYYTQDTLYYNMPSGFNEAIGLFYDVQSRNVPSNSWEFRPDIDMLAISGLGAVTNVSNPSTSARFWGFTTINQLLQIAMLGPNIIPPNTIDPLSNIGSWVASGDASALAVDTNIFQASPSSLSFTITPSGGSATISETLTASNYNFLQYTQNNGQFKFYVYMGTTNFTNVKFRFGSSSSNYYEGTMTTNADGTAWTANTFNKLGVYFNNMTMVGSPNATNIQYFAFIFNEGAGFTTTTTMHINFLFVAVPDFMDLVYYSSFKGYTAASLNLTPKVDIQVFNYNNSNTNTNDYLYFGDIAPDLLGPIAKRAAIELMPQLRQDVEFYNSYRQEVEEWMKIFGKIYPRRRTMNFGETKLRRTRL